MDHTRRVSLTGVRHGGNGITTGVLLNATAVVSVVKEGHNTIPGYPTSKRPFTTSAISSILISHSHARHPAPGIFQ